MVYVSLAVAVFALAFTVASFWWLHAREGSLRAARPRAYAFGGAVRLRFPLALFNDGAKALIVDDLQVVLDDQPAEDPLPWASTRRTLRPTANDVEDFPTPFAIQGRSTKELVAEFGDDRGWRPSPGSKHRLELQAMIHPAEEWVELVTFDWWAPPTEDAMSHYIVHRNEHSRPAE